MSSYLDSVQHFDFSAWQKMDLFTQLGNISSEVGRTFQALRSKDQARARGAFFRGIDLLNATIQTLAKTTKNPKLTSTRLKELILAREEFAKAYIANQPDQALEKYFNNFAIASKLKFLKQF
jgi:hypothetical protein